MGKTQNSNIGPSTLTSDYLLASDKIMQLQTLATLLQMQVLLDLPVDEGLAMEVELFQKEIKDRAEYINGEFMTDFIGIFSDSTNFYYLWNAARDNESVLIKNAVDNKIAKSSSMQVMSSLANQSGLLNQKAKNVAAALSVVKSELDETNQKFDAALNSSIKSLGDSATIYLNNIDALQKKIRKNIDDIVEGANKTGSATSELLIGILTTIKDATPDKPKKDSKEKPEDGKDKPKADPKDKKESIDMGLSTDFVVNSIKAAKEGAEETSQARADLDANNEKLASAFQDLAKANALITVAKVVKVQNDMFVKSVNDSLNAIQTISETWGKTPVLPPATGISLNFLNFSKSIEAIATQEDANDLIEVMDYVKTDWDAFNKKLQYFKRKLTSIP